MGVVVSRNARQYLNRKGLMRTPQIGVSRLDLTDLLVNKVPVPTPLPEKMLGVEGYPPPDRGRVSPWPPH